MNAGDVTIEHCLTEDMWGDFFTKPLQGSKLKSFRFVILQKSRTNKPSPPKSVLKPKDGIRYDAIGGISNLLGGVHITAQKVKIWINEKIIGG